MRIFTLALFVCRLLFATADTVTVTGSISITHENASTGKFDNANAVVWLKPSAAAIDRSSRSLTSRPHFRIVQQHKQFEPHIVVVPVGSVVDFPNLDPFFHNVFSLFDGKRFDLGLYEAGTYHAVTFDTPGVCYVFCNIHPEMSAVVVVVDSPYYATSNPAGQFSIPNVPPGDYVFYVWHERGKTGKPNDYPRPVTISPGSASLGTIRLVDAGDRLVNHKNKYGRDYDYDKRGAPIYKR